MKFYCTREKLTPTGFATGQIEESIIEAAGVELIRNAATKVEMPETTEVYDWRLIRSDAAPNDETKKDES